MKNENIICCSCGAVVKNRKAFAMWHAKVHSDVPLEQERIIVYSLYGKEKVDSLVGQYQAKSICVYGMLPIDIAKYLKLLGIKRTSKEERQTQRYKQTYLKAIQKRYGASITNISQVGEIQKKKEKTFSRKVGSYGAYLDNCRDRMKKGYEEFCKDEARKEMRKDKIEQSLKERYGVSNASQILEVRESISEKAKERMRNMSTKERRMATQKAREAVPHNWWTTTKIERMVLDGLVVLGYNPIQHHREGRYSIDIVIGEKAIEVQGDVYHANPKLYIGEDEILKGTRAKDVWERDARKKRFLEARGYSLITLWESEIRENKGRIVEWLKEKGL